MASAWGAEVTLSAKQTPVAMRPMTMSGTMTRLRLRPAVSMEMISLACDNRLKQ